MRISAHDSDYFAKRFEPHIWEPSYAVGKEGYTGRPYQHCSFCGSMRPEELLVKLQEGARAHQADWKYGWPHKLYVQFINPIAGQRVKLGSTVLPNEPSGEERAKYENWQIENVKIGGTTVARWSADLYGPSPATLQAKFYTLHMLDCPDDIFEELSKLIEQKAGLSLTMRDGGLHYSS
jgi:hypothetical protein